MLKNINPLLPLLVCLFFACQSDTEEVPCPADLNFGLLTVSPESLDFLPEGYENNEKLIFSNAEGEEMTFYPQSGQIQETTSSTAGSIWCEGGRKNGFEYEVKALSLSYRSTSDYILLIKLQTQHINNEGNAAVPVSFFDQMEVHLLKVGEHVLDTEWLCLLSIPTSYRGEAPFEVGKDYHFVEEVALGEALYRDIYQSDCGGSHPLSYQKQAGLVAFTDTEGELWTLERTEAYENEQAPDIVLPDTSGQLLHLSDIEGELILIDFWASWCGPCRVETEETLKPLYQDYADKGLEILSVSIDTDKAAWQAAIEADGMDWYHASDLQGYSSAVFTDYQIFGIPTIYVLDEEHNILSKNKRGEVLMSFVEQYLD